MTNGGCAFEIVECGIGDPLSIRSWATGM